ncbi:TPA: hypothetical protein DCZ32_03160 [Candidatus Uhrbacteria bacterium]|nr:hypothetical protein [Candidatus Uhrbacteria bacterium]
MSTPKLKLSSTPSNPASAPALLLVKSGLWTRRRLAGTSILMCRRLKLRIICFGNIWPIMI